LTLCHSNGVVVIVFDEIVFFQQLLDFVLKKGPRDLLCSLRKVCFWKHMGVYT